MHLVLRESLGLSWDFVPVGSVMELVDIRDLKSRGTCARGGSIPPAPTIRLVA